MVETPPYRYCPMCGLSLTTKCLHGDVKLRQVCEHCGFVRYVNPLPVVGTIPVFEGKVLLCRRAIEPRKGYWTLPAGFMEGYETLKEGAARETLEETGSHVAIDRLFSIIDVPEANQIHFFFLAQLTALPSEPGIETLEQRLFNLDEIPWDELSFTTVIKTLECFIEDVKGEVVQLHTFRLSH